MVRDKGKQGGKSRLQENGQHAVGSDQVPESRVFPFFLFPGRRRIALSLIFLSVKCFLYYASYAKWL